MEEVYHKRWRAGGRIGVRVPCSSVRCDGLGGVSSAAEGGVVEAEEGLIVGSGIGAHGDNVELVFPGQITRFKGDKLAFEVAQKLRVQNVIELLIGGTEEQCAFLGDGAGEKEIV